ncbi:MAG: serine hydrolase [Lachnospiraceae bacterium]|nr:serine hydrolase [Lachnospiraceae bacterium]
MSGEFIQYTSPEKVGISSGNIEKYLRILEQNKLATHSLILARGNQIFFEHYWEPFHKDFLHRMYSVSKSFVAIAIGFLEQDGLIDLDDPISKYFVQELEKQPDVNMHNQTIRHMLMMSTAKTPKGWFKAGTEDRVRFYFENDTKYSRPSGTLFEYDSPGSFVLGALVERLTEMPFMEYLREKLFREIGVSEEAYCLKCPGGHSWGDSAVICRPIDLFLVARFMLNGGRWNGKQLLNEEFVKAATTKQIDNNYLGIHDWNTQGYGYLFWMTYQNSFFFNGMGSQYAVCVPEQDLIMVINSDNQGKEAVRKDIIDSFFELIVNQATDVPLPENHEAQYSLMEYAKRLKLLTQPGEKDSTWKEKVHGVTYHMNENPMGIRTFKITFEGDKGCFAYTNEQGDKELYFGLGYNEFGVFPQEGYSDEVGSQYASGNYYKCAASAAWTEESKLQIMVQIIDRYFGNMTITLGFKDGEAGVFMHKNAECFLEEYQGYGMGRMCNETRS